MKHKIGQKQKGNSVLVLYITSIRAPQKIKIADLNKINARNGNDISRK